MKEIKRGLPSIALAFAWAVFCFCCVPTPAFAQVTNYALGFDAAQAQSVGIPHQAAQDGYPFTVMCWFMEPTNSSGNGAFVGNYVSSSFNGWQLASGGGQLYAWYYRANGNDVGRTTAAAVNDGLWHHAAFVVTSAGGVIYLDGVPKQTNAWAGTAGPCTTTGNIYLGLYQGDSFLTADLDEVSVWNVALTPAQIQTYMHQPLQGTETGLVNYYRMNEGSGTNIYDSTIDADTGTFPPSPNSPTWILSGAQLQEVPQVVTQPATVLTNSATMSGTINPQGLNSGSWFNWGLTTSYGNVTATNTFAAGYSIFTNTITLSNLSAGTYHFQIAATNASGTNFGADQSFSIMGPPQLATLPATVNGNSAALNGTINPQGRNSGSWFNWGLTTSYGNSTATNTFAAGYSVFTNTITLTNLSPATYHFQIVATNASGTNYGADQTFLITEPPQVATLPATVSGNSVTLSGTLDPEGLDSSSWFNWGLTANYGNVTTTNIFSAGYIISTNTETLSGVLNGTYHFQIVAANADGTNFGVDQSFTIDEPFQLGTSNLLVGPIAGTNSVILAANGSWTVTPNASWLHVPPPFPSSGVGSTNIIFTLDANPGVTRSGTISIADQTLTVTQVGSNYVAAPEPAITLATNGLHNPYDVAVDTAGNAYIADYNAGIFEWVKTNDTLRTLVSGNYQSSGIAVDRNGNVYFSSIASNSISEWVAASGHVITLVGSGLNYPTGVAVDSAGNVYIADTLNNAIKEWVAANSNVVTLGAGGLAYPSGVAVDIAGNVYIADGGNGRIVEWSPGSETTLSFDPDYLLDNLVVDGSGNVFFDNVSDIHVAFANFEIFEWSAVNKTVNVAVSNGISSYGAAVDNAGNIFIADVSGSGALKELPHAFLDPSARSESFIAGIDTLPAVLPANALQFAPFVPASDESWLTITSVTNGVTQFSFPGNYGLPRVAHISQLTTSIEIDQSAIILGTTNLLEGPAAGTDSVMLAVPPPIIPLNASANGGWLHPSAIYQPNTGGTNIIFTYDANSGPTRTGRISIGSGGVDQTITVTQAGAPYMAAPAPLTTLVPYGTGATFVQGMVVDNEGNVYFADPTNHVVKEWVAADNSVIILTSHLSFPAGLAIDNVDNLLFIADEGTGALYVCALPDPRLLKLATLGPISSANIALDSFDNVYFVDVGDSIVKRWSIDSGNIGSLITNMSPSNITLDNAGNMYISGGTVSGTNNFGVLEWIAATSNLVTRVSGVSGSVAVDGSGNIYIENGGELDKWTATTGTLSPIVSGTFYNVDLCVDNNRDVYIADAENGAVEELPRGFVDPTPRFEAYPGGSDVLPPILPAGFNLQPPFAPVTDQPWLTVTNTADGIVDFDFTSNIGLLSPRTGHITVLGESVPVIQTNAPVTPPNLIGTRLFGNGSFQFTFMDSPGTTFTVLATTNVAMPLTNWVKVGTVSNSSPGIYQFTSQPMTNAQEFYQVVWP